MATAGYVVAQHWYSTGATTRCSVLPASCVSPAEWSLTVTLQLLPQCFRMHDQHLSPEHGHLAPAHCVLAADFTPPQTCRLLVQLKALGIDNIMKFEWLAPPPAETMVRALENLHALGVLDNDARCGAGDRG